mgnify:CR=1 FL=1
MVLIIFVFSVSESSIVIVTLRTDYSALWCQADKGQLSVAVQCHLDKGQVSIVLDLRLCISRVNSALIEQWPFVKIVFENFY